MLTAQAPHPHTEQQTLTGSMLVCTMSHKIRGAKSVSPQAPRKDFSWQKLFGPVFEFDKGRIVSVLIEIMRKQNDLQVCTRSILSLVLQSNKKMREYNIYVSLFVLPLCPLQYNAKTKHNIKIITSSSSPV